MESKFDIGFMLICIKQAIGYIPNTLLLSIVPFLLGIIIGTIIALSRIYKVKVLNQVFHIYVVLIKGIPVVLLIFITYFAVIQGFDAVAKFLHMPIQSKDISLTLVAIIALTTFSTASISEAIRGALLSVGGGQYEAGYSVGLTTWQTLRRIIIPQALPTAIPMLCSCLIGLVKGSSLVFMISVTDLLYAALLPANANYKYLEAYVAAAIVYWGLNIIIEKLAYVLERRLNLHNKEGAF
jgi:L-cystine transport system permease protein